MSDITFFVCEPFPYVIFCYFFFFQPSSLLFFLSDARFEWPHTFAISYIFFQQKCLLIIPSKISTVEFFLCTLADLLVSFPKMFRAAILQRTCQWNLPLVSNVFEKIIYDHRKFSQPGIVWIP